MKTLSLNKLLILIGLFLVSALFTTGANATCVAVDGVITTVSGNSNTPVFDTRAPTTAVDACTQTPDEYKVTLFKLGLCTADTSFNDLSSCQYIINSTAGVEEVIKFPATNTMNIPEFAIEPGSYGYMVVVLGSKLGIKHNFQTSNAIDGATGTGTHCWTSNTGYTGFTSEDGVSVTGWGNSTVGGTQMLECGPSAGTAVFTHEVINKLNGDTCSATWVANGDRWPVVDENGDPEIVGNGTAVINILQADDTFATACANGYKLLWTTNLTTPILVTEESSFGLQVKSTDSVSLDFSNDHPSAANDKDIIKAGADPVQLYLTVTD